MPTAFKILIIVALAAVVIVLVRGLFNMLRGGSGMTSNKLMQARVLLQAIALVIIMLAARNTKVMGTQTIGPVLTALGWIVTIAMFVALLGLALTSFVS